MKVAQQIAEAMGYDYIALFLRARDALAAWRVMGSLHEMPSNICPQAYNAMPGRLVPVSPQTGIAETVPVHLYGYRSLDLIGDLDIDPLMTGLRFRPKKHSIISFGRGKILSAGGGGAFLTNDRAVYKLMQRYSYWPSDLDAPLEGVWYWRHTNWAERWRRMEWWDRMLGDSCVRIPKQQIMPWRCIRRIPEKRDAVVKALRAAGHAVGTNYPPLPGATDEGAIQWGHEVINFFVNDDYDEHKIANACWIIKRTLEQ